MIRWLILCSCLFLLGCGTATPEGRVSARGLISLSDGQPLDNVMGTVSFVPVDPKNPMSKDALNSGSLSGRRCVAWITKEGTFELSTGQSGDGTVPGHYKVLLQVRNMENKYDPRVPGHYAEYDESPWVVEVKPGTENYFELSIDPDA